MNSLWARLLTTTGVVLLVFMVLVGFALEKAVRVRIDQAQHDSMQGLSYALLGNAEIKADGSIKIPQGVLPEARLAQPGSGLYAMVVDETGSTLWRSPSAYGTLRLQELPAIGEWQFTRGRDAEDNELIVLTFGFRWIMPTGDDYRYTLIVAEDAEVLQDRMQRFSSALWTVLIVASFFLLVAVLLVLRWGMAPLRRLTRALHDLQTDEKREIEGHYPEEIEPLVNNLNIMLANDQARLQRYRNALGDLAHSFKTPLAVLHGFANEPDLTDEQRKQLKHQLSRMNDILDYQLQKAATAGRRALLHPIDIAPVIDRLARTLTKVYAQRKVEFKNHIAPDIQARIDAGDLTELMGTLMDNAAKYGHRHVDVFAKQEPGQIQLIIDDDGPGFPKQQVEQLLRRGERADTTREGQGLGLAMAAEIVDSYNGELKLMNCEFEGARVVVTLPVKAAK